MIDAPFADAYAANMANFICDVRKDLHAPDLPFVIGQMGQNGFKPASGGVAKVKEAQAAMEKLPEFKGTVKCVVTDVFWDADADKLIANWQQHKECPGQSGQRLRLSLSGQRTDLLPHRSRLRRGDGGAPQKIALQASIWSRIPPEERARTISVAKKSCGNPISMRLTASSRSTCGRIKLHVEAGEVVLDLRPACRAPMIGMTGIGPLPQPGQGNLGRRLAALAGHGHDLAGDGLLASARRP